MSKVAIGLAVVGTVLFLVLIHCSPHRDPYTRSQLLERLARLAEDGYPLSSIEIVYPPAGPRPDGGTYVDSTAWEEYYMAIAGGDGELWDYSAEELERVYRYIVDGEDAGELYPQFREDVLTLSRTGISARRFVCSIEDIARRPEALVSPTESVKVYLRAARASANEHVGRAIEVCHGTRFEFYRRTVPAGLDLQEGVIPGGIDLPLGPSMILMRVLSAAMRAHCIDGDADQSARILMAAHDHLTAYRGSHSFCGAHAYAYIGFDWLQMVEEWLFCFGDDTDRSTFRWIEKALQNLGLAEELESAIVGERARALDLYRSVERGIPERLLPHELPPPGMAVTAEFDRDRLAMLDCLEQCLQRIRTGTGFESRDGTGYEGMAHEMVGQLEPIGQVVLSMLPALLKDYAYLSDVQRLALASTEVSVLGLEEALARDENRQALFPGGRLTFCKAKDGSRELRLLPSHPGYASRLWGDPWSVPSL